MRANMLRLGLQTKPFPDPCGVARAAAPLQLERPPLSKLFQREIPYSKGKPLIPKGSPLFHPAGW